MLLLLKARCFEVFRMFHQLVNTHQALYTATVDVIHEFVADNVQYLELRTTPRQLEGSLRNYADVVIKAIELLPLKILLNIP